jgi:hypothetical protein
LAPEREELAIPRQRAHFSASIIWTTDVSELAPEMFDLMNEVQTIVEREFGERVVAGVEVELGYNHLGEESWNVLVILKRPLGSSAPVLRVLRMANDYLSRRGDERFAYIHYATRKEAREKKEAREQAA